MKFYLGVNYWDSLSGTDMWRNFDPEVVRKDVAALAEYGVRVMRVFPNWRDFQPVTEYLARRGSSHGFCDYRERPLQNPEGIDEEMIADFRTFSEICEAYGIPAMNAIVWDRS